MAFVLYKAIAYQNQFDIAKEYIDNFKTKEAEHELEPAENKRSS